MNEENRPLVVRDEAVEFKKWLVEVQDFWEKHGWFLKNLWNIPRSNKSKPKDVNMYPFGLGNIGILTDYVQKIFL